MPRAIFLIEKTVWFVWLANNNTDLLCRVLWPLDQLPSLLKENWCWELVKVATALVVQTYPKCEFPVVGTAGSVCNPSTGKVDIGGSLELTGQSCRPNLNQFGFRLGEIHILKVTWRTTEERIWCRPLTFIYSWTHKSLRHLSSGQAWWHRSTITTTWKARKETHKLRVCLDYRVSAKPAWAA